MLIKIVFEVFIHSRHDLIAACRANLQSRSAWPLFAPCMSHHIYFLLSLFSSLKKANREGRSMAHEAGALMFISPAFACFQHAPSIFDSS